MRYGFRTGLLVLALLAGLLACETPSPEPYIQELRSRDRDERLKAANKLLRFGEEAVPLLLEEADSEYIRVRFEVMKLLGRIKDPRAIDVLIEGLGDESTNVARAAAWSLGELRTSRALPALLGYADDVSKGMREVVIRSLGRCRAVSLDSANFALDDSVYQVVFATLQDSVPSVRIAAMQSLQVFGYRGSVGQMIRLSRDPSPEVRHVAVQALGQIAVGEELDPSVEVVPRMRKNIMEALIAALDEPYQSIRTKAVRALDKIADAEVVPHLEHLKASGTAEDKRESTRVLEKLQDGHSG